MRTRLHDPAGTIVAAALIVLGIVLTLQTERMTAMGSVFPITVSVALIVFSAILIARNLLLTFRGGEVPAAEPGEMPPVGGSNIRRALFTLAMILWIVLVPILGFLAASILGYFAIMLVAMHERMGIKQIALLVLLGLAILFGFYVLMSNILLIPMPRGWLF